MAITKPSMNKLWASGGAVVQPSDTKIETGWTAEVPPHQWENWIQHRQDEFLAHVNERGIPEWDGLTDYLASGKSYVQGSDGIVYMSVAASGPATTVQDPTTDVTDTYWKSAFAVASAAEAQAWTDNTKQLTPLRLADAFKGGNQSLVTNGYQKIPGGLIVQWGSYSYVDLVDTTPFSVTFPVSYPTGALSFVAVADSSQNDISVVIDTLSQSSVVVRLTEHDGAVAAGIIRWTSLGY